MIQVTDWFDQERKAYEKMRKMKIETKMEFDCPDDHAIAFGMALEIETIIRENFGNCIDMVILIDGKLFTRGDF